jgi:MFS family permease
LLTATLILFQLDRGLSVAQALTAMAFAGIVTVLLELPTSAIADGTGRRRVYLTAAVANVAAGVAFVVADSFWSFAAAAALFGIFRALDSGPLEAWFVDADHAHHPGPTSTACSRRRAAFSVPPWRSGRCRPQG